MRYRILKMLMARNTMKKEFSLNDHLFNEESVSYLASCFKANDPLFEDTAFIEEVCDAFPELTLKQRIAKIAEVLERYLPDDFIQASTVIQASLPAPLDPKKTDDDFGKFIFAPLGEYVVRNGCTKATLETAYQTLYEITQRFSMEDAIRTFINRFPEETLQVLSIWAHDPHYHVRRLVSEGTRPLLPWSGRIIYTSQQTFPLLDVLFSDRTRYVTRSVANHLNDISKKEPDAVIKRLQLWRKENLQTETELAWMSRHALRTLLKEGNASALAFLGYGIDPKVTLVSLSLAPHSESMQAGEHLEFSCEIQALEDTMLMIDYSIDFVKANGGVKPKMFKLKKAQIKEGEHISIHKKHRLLSDATTYTLYSGEHAVTLYINGKAYGRLPFTIALDR